MRNWKEMAETQPAIVKMLTNSVTKGRLAHAYLFSGGRGTGKKAVASLLAKSYFCEQKTGSEPCQSCKECQRIDSGNHPDLHEISADGTTIKVEQIRQLKKEFSLRGMESHKKFYIVNEADKMTDAAANSLLKVLEEPDGEAVAVLITSHIQRILKTILSRAQVLSFAPLPVDKLVHQLVTIHTINEKDALTASRLTSDMEEALQLCQNDWIAQARNKVIQLIDDLTLRPRYVFITLQEEWIPFFKEKTDVQIGIDLLMLWYRDVIRVQVEQTDQIVYIDQEDKLQDQALKLSQMKLGHNLQAVMDAKRRLDANTAPQLLMEQLLLRLQEG
ncbi:DNA polymerase III subunit delta' [Salipaludibacillus agaradhaerens]|jgi:DNA polymerase-3 subunit delta'|uniref:DNA polymerase III subunit delta' n=1 Tax=Salipaludibacillus agaradhaerens TaxID=76935 RepID=A0A9Q4FZ61_SALAG|nr:DNA polymerase III subunit delta' [Salipaludibacillus agaradhaerens]MCR6098430.1 DNA polymerase III subunit delta' [Salipaludibacillus agaradhaerens]MCR6115940.1 DNA polymerase III subunit delta' [Salipaludibacillus agaradhaerens]